MFKFKILNQENNSKNIKPNTNKPKITNEVTKKQITNITKRKLVLFLSENYGYFKQFTSIKDLYEIGKVNKKFMSLFIVEEGHELYNKQQLIRNKLKEIDTNNINKLEISTKEFLKSKEMKKIFIYLKNKQYIDFFKNVKPPINDKLLEIYKIYYLIINNDYMIKLFEISIEKFWKKMIDEFVIRSLDGENLDEYIYYVLLKNLSFDFEHVLKISKIWKEKYRNKYQIDDVTKESPTTGIILLMIEVYLEFCGIIETTKSNRYYINIIYKYEFLDINQKILFLVDLYKKLNINKVKH